MANEGAKSAERIQGDIQGARVQEYIFFAAQVVAGVWFFYEVVAGVYRWLRYGNDTTVRLSTYLLVPHTGWVGVNRIIAFIWHLPISLTLFVAVLILGLCGEAKRQEVLELKGKQSELKPHQVNG